MVGDEATERGKGQIMKDFISYEKQEAEDPEFYFGHVKFKVSMASKWTSQVGRWITCLELKKRP